MKSSNQASVAVRYCGLIIVLCSLLFVPSVQAKQRTEQEVLTAVETWVRNTTPDARPDAVVEQMEPYVVEERPVAYIAHLSDGGFCLCGADDLASPVYYYSPHGRYDDNNPFLQYVLQGIKHETETLRRAVPDQDIATDQQHDVRLKRVEVWTQLTAGSVPQAGAALPEAAGEPQTLTLGLTSLWQQGSPYNDSCPVLTPGSDEHAVVGCLPLAMALTMHYWQWPNIGEGTASRDYDRWWTSDVLETPLANDPGVPSTQLWRDRLDWTSSDGGKLRMQGYWDDSLWRSAKTSLSGVADYDDPLYQSAVDALWDTMTDAGVPYTHHDPIHNEVNFGAATYNWAVMEDTCTDPPDACGIAVSQVGYHCGVASQAYWGIMGTFQGSVPSGMNAMEANFRYDSDAHSTDFDLNGVIDEVSWLRPLIMCTAGHCIVTFGYDLSGSEPMLNINTGWGYSDWYTLNDWDIMQASANLAPESVKFVGSGSGGDGSPDSPYGGIERAVDDAPDGATLILKAGSVNTSAAGTLVIDRRLIIKGHSARIE